MTVLAAARGRSRWRGLLAVVLGWLSGTGMVHAESGREFSADVVRTRSGGQGETGRLFVGHAGVRSEGMLGGRRVVLLHDFTRKRILVLFPDQKVYVLQDGVDVRPPPLPDGPDSPCRQQPDRFLCTRAAAPELVDGRTVVRWTVAVKGGTAGESRELWIDPVLQFAIREQAGETVTALRNIREESHAPELFALPGDYRQIAMPTGFVAPAGR